MKILYYCPEYHYRHGGRTHARGFFHALADLPQVSESHLYPPSLSGECCGNGAEKRGKLGFLPKTVRKVLQFFRPRPALTRELVNEIRRHDSDALVIRTGIIQPSISGIRSACPRVTICLEVNSIFFEEGFQSLPFRPIFRRWETRRFDQADAIVVVSSWLKARLEADGIEAGKILVNHNGVEPVFFDIKRPGSGTVRRKYRIPPEAFVIGYVGGMEPFRRLPEVVHRFAELRRRGETDLYLLLIGDGQDMEAVRDVIEKNREVLGESVILTGWVSHQEVPDYLAEFDLAIFPFTNEYCSPLKLFEYLAAGLPTLGPDTQATREVFKDRVHLGLVRQDGSNFAEWVLRLKTDSNLRRQLGEEGRKLVRDRFTWKKNAENVVAHIHDFARRAAG